MRSIGDRVWRGSFEASTSYVICPDCCGSGRLRVIMGDESVVSIECAGCQSGYDPPTGRITVYDRKGYTTIATVSGIVVNNDGINYRVSTESGHIYFLNDREVFDTKEAADAYVDALASDLDKRDREKVLTKESPKRTWSWNAHYHRKEIKEAQRRLEYHTAKLTVAERSARHEKASAAGN